jgi:lipopolysaccharide/colanic/teichoic acid biosynthesis glycosyltransferase
MNIQNVKNPEPNANLLFRLKLVGVFLSVSQIGVLIMSIITLSPQIEQCNNQTTYVIVPLAISILFLIAYSALTTRSLMKSTRYLFSQFIKRLIDVITSSSIIFFLSPIAIIISIFIKINSKGPIFYRSKRVGQFGKLFDAFKFRTFVASGPEKRITKIGRILRRAALDELPLFLNVLEGDMSLVGPRPNLQVFWNSLLNNDKKILEFKPGIVSYSAIKYRLKPQTSNKSIESIYKDIIKYDLEYVNNWSLLFDLKLLFKSIYATIKNS